jgi:hypothetical protein
MGGQTDLRGENGLVVELILDPGDEVVDVLWRTAFDGFLDVDPISPQILEAAMVRTEIAGGYRGPAVITGQVCGVQNSVMLP